MVRSIYDAWGRGDFRAGTELYDPEVQLVLRPEFPDAGVYRGSDEIRTYMREDFLRDWEAAVIVGEEFLDAGDSVVVRVHQQATGPGSGAPISARGRLGSPWRPAQSPLLRVQSRTPARC